MRNKAQSESNSIERREGVGSLTGETFLMICNRRKLILKVRNKIKLLVNNFPKN